MELAQVLHCTGVDEVPHALFPVGTGRIDAGLAQEEPEHPVVLEQLLGALRAAQAQNLCSLYTVQKLTIQSSAGSGWEMLPQPSSGFGGIYLPHQGRELHYVAATATCAASQPEAAAHRVQLDRQAVLAT